MPRGLSSSILPVKVVLPATTRALSGLVAERAALRSSLISEHRKSRPGFRSWMLSDDSLWKTMPPEIIKIYDLHRASDEKVLKALNGLCRTAMQYGENFTITVTVDDYRLIADFIHP